MGIRKWLCPCGKVVPTTMGPETKGFKVHYGGDRHQDWLRYGKVVPEYIPTAASPFFTSGGNVFSAPPVEAPGRIVLVGSSMEAKSARRYP